MDQRQALSRNGSSFRLVSGVPYRYQAAEARKAIKSREIYGDKDYRCASVATTLPKGDQRDSFSSFLPDAVT